MTVPKPANRVSRDAVRYGILAEISMTYHINFPARRFLEDLHSGKSVTSGKPIRE